VRADCSWVEKIDAERKTELTSQTSPKKRLSERVRRKTEGEGEKEPPWGRKRVGPHERDTFPAFKSKSSQSKAGGLVQKEGGYLDGAI